MELEVKPEKSIGSGSWEFALGMPLLHVIQVLKIKLHYVKNISINFSEQNPLDRDLEVDLRDQGILLKFHPQTQRLKLIELYNLSKVVLKYCNNEFSSADILPTYSRIEGTFGAVYKRPVVDHKLKCHLLSWPGISFAFPLSLDHKPAEHYPDDVRTSKDSFLPLWKVFIFSGQTYGEAESLPIPLSCFQGNCFAKMVEVVMKGGQVKLLKVTLLGNGGYGGGHGSQLEKTVCVRFGATSQDVLSLLGAPSKVFYKAEDKMRIHLKTKYKQTVSDHSDYFFNYFTMGMDVLFDAVTHTVKKFVLHTNYPGHYNFGIYHRCNFLLSLSGGSGQSLTQVNPFSVWGALHLCESSEEPYLLRRNPSTNVDVPFASSQCYVQGNVIFEVMENGHIGSVTLFSENFGRG